MKIHRIGPLSAGKLGGVTYGFMGLIFGAIFSLIAVIGAAASGIAGEEGALGLLFGAGAIIILPVFYGVLGFVGFAVGALIYNLAARLVGGLEIEAS